MSSMASHSGSIDNDFLGSIREAQKSDVKLVDLINGVGQSEDEDFKLDSSGVLRFRGRICVPDDEEMRKAILEEGHRSKLSIHPGATKMYQDRSFKEKPYSQE